MMRRLFLTLCSGLLLVCCDKPESSGTRADSKAPASRTKVRGHSPREPIQGTPAALRELLETALGIESDEVRGKALADVAWNALEIDPELACEAFMKLPAGNPDRIRLIQHYAMRLAEQNADEALVWADTLGTEQETAAAKGQIALALAESDPQRAANLLSESGIAGREFDVTVVQVVQRWAAQNPPDTAAWVVRFPEGPAREAGIKIIASRWLQTDTPGAFSWLAGLQDPGVRREAALGLEEAILQQPAEIRDQWLQHADEPVRGELEQQREQAIKEMGDNIPPPAK